MLDLVLDGPIPWNWIFSLDSSLGNDVNLIRNFLQDTLPKIAKIVPTVIRNIAGINLNQGTSCSNAPAVRNINRPIHQR
jgi:hypothetical protein